MNCHDIHITTEFSDILCKLKVDQEKQQFVETAEKAYQAARSMVRPGIVYQRHPVRRADCPSLDIGEVTFANNALYYNLAETAECVIYLMTLGPDFTVTPDDPSDYLLGYYLDLIGNIFLRNLRKQLIANLAREYDASPLSRMSPGSTEVFPLAESDKLFAVLGDEAGEIGVSLSDSHLMLPFKTVSGILFHKEERYVDCLLCQQTDCEARQAQYDPHLAPFYQNL